MQTIIQKYQQGKFTTKDWTETGLLNHLDDQQATQVITLFELSMPQIIKLYEKKSPITKLILPAIRNIYGRLTNSKFATTQNIPHLWATINVKKIITELKKCHTAVFEHIKYFKYIDHEVEFLEIFVGEQYLTIIEQLKKISENKLPKYLLQRHRNLTLNQLL